MDYHHLNKQTMAFVMAGGRGSRLRNLTEKRSKPAVFFGGNFRIIDFVLSNCINSGIRKIAVLTQYKAHSLIRHLQRTWGFFNPSLGEMLEIFPASQQLDGVDWYRGTADSIYQNINSLGDKNIKYALILAGDHIYKMDYIKMLQQHIEEKAVCTVGCIEVPLEDASQFGVMGVDKKNQIQSFLEKPKNPPPMPNDPKRALASMGIYVFNFKDLKQILEEDTQDLSSEHDFGKNIIPKLVRQKMNCRAHPFSASCIKNPSYSEESYWKDVGTVSAYWQANIDLTTPSPKLDIYDSNWQIYSYQPTLPCAKFIFNDDNRKGYAVDSITSNGCVISGAEIKNSVISMNTKINSFTTVHNSVILPDSSVGRHSRLNKVILERNCHLPPKTVIGYDLEEDKRWFYVANNGAVLITESMIERWKVSR